MSFDPTLPRAGSARTDIAPSSPPSARSAELRRRLAKTDSEVPSIGRPRGASYRHVVDWEHVGLVGAGLLIGALVGAGAALLLAPQSGAEARTALRRKAHLARHRSWRCLGRPCQRAGRCCTSRSPSRAPRSQTCTLARQRRHRLALQLIENRLRFALKRWVVEIDSATAHDELELGSCLCLVAQIDVNLAQIEAVNDPIGIDSDRALHVRDCFLPAGVTENACRRGRSSRESVQRRSARMTSAFHTPITCSAPGWFGLYFKRLAALRLEPPSRTSRDRARPR